MEAQFKLSRKGEFGLIVEGLEKELGEYLPSSSEEIEHRAYTWEHSTTINFLLTVNSENETTFVDHHISEHKNSNIDISEFTVTHDGLHIVSHSIIPTREWIDHVIGSGGNFDTYAKVFYYDLGKVFEYKTSEEVDIRDFYVFQNSEYNTIVEVDKNTFVTFYLDKCFTLLIKNLLKCVHGNVSCPNPDILSKERERDLIWMFINAIKYHVELGQLYEAQRLLEKLHKCNTICKRASNSKNQGCGC